MLRGEGHLMWVVFDGARFHVDVGREGWTALL